MKKLSVVVPIYYNEQSIPLLFGELVKVENTLLQMNVELELIFVDDGSGDNSLQELLNIKKKSNNTKIIKLTRNFGAVSASKTGKKFITGDCFMVIAADLQDPPSLIPEMVQHWLDGNKYVVAVRKGRDDPVLTKIFSRIYYKILKCFVFKDFPSDGYGIALMDKTLLPYFHSSGKNINPSLFGQWLGFNPKVIHYQREKRLYGKSRWTFSKKLNFFLDSILGFSVIPIRIILSIGIAISLISFFYGFWILINTILGRMDIKGFATIVVLISFLLGVVISMLGVIGEYIWRMYDEVNKRPESVIDEIY